MNPALSFTDRCTCPHINTDQPLIKRRWVVVVVGRCNSMTYSSQQQKGNRLGLQHKNTQNDLVGVTNDLTLSRTIIILPNNYIIYNNKYNQLIKKLN